MWVMASLALPAIGVGLALQERAAPMETAQVSHQVAAGETLSAIAARYNISVNDLIRANGLSNPDVIFAGQTLVIPRAVGATGESVHIVAAGESLSAIASRYGITATQIAQANSIADINRIYAGQHLLIPSGGGVPSTSGSTAPASTPASTSATSNIAHTVRAGDTLYRISLVYGVPVDDLIAANHLSNPNALTPGQEVRIPSSTSGSASTSTYVIRPGDTLAEIAIRYNTTVDGLATANGISNPSRIYPGQVLTIPSPGAVAREYPAQSATSHTVAQGETLGRIALRYGVTVSALAAANGISNPARIYPGQVLSIPSSAAGSASIRYASYGPGLCGEQAGGGGSGYFIRPMRGYVISQYFHPWHPGIDLAIPSGSKVYAVDGGTVVYAGWNPAGYGNLIILDHGDGWRTYYAHLSQIHVECGEIVPRGSIIGASGNTGNSTGPHLHFEMLRYGAAVNPAGYLGF